MFKDKIHRIYLLLGILTLIIGSLFACNKLQWIVDTTGYEKIIGFATFLICAVLLLLWILPVTLDAEGNREQEIIKGNVPVYESNCTHISGLASFTAEGKIRIYVDRIHFTVAGTHYELPIERIRSADILTQKQTDTVLNENFGRTLLATLLFGELGALISIERSFKEKEITITEENLVITYEKDGEAKFIVLKNLPCDKVIREIKKLVPLAPRQVEL